MDLTRRQVLAGLSAVTIVMLGDPTVSAAQVSSAALPPTKPWSARAGEVQAAIKWQATRLIQAVGAWTAGQGTASAARRRASAAGFDPGLVDRLTSLLGSESAAVLQVRDAQYGGLLNSSASVLVVADQWRQRSDGTTEPGGTTVEVLLTRARPHWRVVAVNQAHPARPASRVSTAASRVLGDSRIRLPHAAYADVTAGQVHDSVLRALSALAASHVVDVSVLRSGHPLHVFGTTRMSDHPRGRAVDIWALDGLPLVIPSHHPLAVSAMEFAVDHGAYNVGGPVQLNGREYFSDLTHRDHIHLGFPT